VTQGALAAFFSYCREDSGFALRLVDDLKAAGANVWLDQRDILPGQRWDHVVEDALTNCPRMVVLLSSASVNSTNVMDEVSFALEEQKTVIPVIYRDCTVPFRLRRVQHVDFRQDYGRGLQALLNILAPAQSAGQAKSAASEVGSQDQPKVSDAAKRQRAAEQARLEDERQKAAEQSRLEKERKQAAEQARVEEERKSAAEESGLKDARQKAERNQEAVSKLIPLVYDELRRSVHSSAARVAVPELSKWFWLASISCLLVLVTAALSNSAIRDSLFHIFSAHPKPPAGIPSLEEGKHVIVLPFDFQGDRETLGFISEGLDEELSRKLSSLQILHVVSASAAEEQARQQKVDLKGSAEAIARNFGINLIVRGTVQEGGGWTRINVEFDDVPGARELLNKHFSYPAAAINLLELNQQVYDAILRELNLKLGADERRRAANPTTNIDAYQHYLHGRYALRNRRNSEAVRTAIGFFEKAIQEDPHFALAYVRLSDACRAMYRATKDSLWINRSFEAAYKAQSLSDDLPEIHLALGDIYRQVGQSKEAVAEYEKARKLSPSSDVPWLRLGKTYENAGQPVDAIDAYMKATQQNPYSLVNRIELGAAYFNFHDYEKALAQFRIVIDLDPGNYEGYMNTGAVHLAQGEWKESIRDFETAIARDDAPDDADIHTDLGTAYFYMKRYADSVKENEKAVSIRANDYVLVGNLADAYRWAESKFARETYQKAIELASEQLKINPKDTDVLGNLALFYAKSGNLTKAANFIRQARVIDPSQSDLMYYEATIRMLAKENAEALRCLRLALENGYSRALFVSDPEFGGFANNAEFKKLLTDYGYH
jgi:tetratricopeptide (TPR) repeat protein